MTQDEIANMIAGMLDCADRERKILEKKAAERGITRNQLLAAAITEAVREATQETAGGEASP